MRHRLLPLLGLTLLLSAASPWAQALDAAKGKVLLTISGAIGEKNQGDLAVFDAALLDRFKVYSITTVTPWYEGAKTFKGPRLKDVLAAVGAKGQKLHIKALNDYATVVPIADAEQWGVVMARSIDDKPLTVREKGPLFLIYPFDQNPELKNDIFYNRCAWQMASIRVE